MKNSKSPTVKQRRRRTRDHKLHHQSLKQQPKSAASGSDPLPGPSGILPKSPTAGPSLDCGPSDGRVKSTKRKNMTEKEQGSPSKKSRSTSPRRGKTKARRTPLDKVWRKGPNEDSSRDEEKKDDRPEGGQEGGPGSTSCGPKQRRSPSESSTPESSSCTDSDESTLFHRKYIVEELLGEGGFGKVYWGFRIEDKFPVAIKRIAKHKVDFIRKRIDGEVKRLPREVFLLMQVGAGPGSASCSITPLLLDWYNLEHELVLVFERPEPCMDLHDYIHYTGLNKKEAKIIFRQLVEKAIKMDARGVFHRDIKSRNILIETGGDVPKAKYIDFGCGALFKPEQIFDEASGTPEFAAPEWFRESGYAAGPTTVWQLGLVLFLMLFKRRPLIREHSIGSNRSVPIPSNISQECRDILRGCLEKNPEKRFSLQNVRDHPWLKSE